MHRFVSSAASSSSGRAEQPAAASELAPYIESSARSSAGDACASNGSYTSVFRFASMNLGWQITSKKHTAEWLCTAVEDVIQARAPDALGLSEIFEIDDDSEVATVRKKNLLKMVLGRWSSEDNAAQLVCMGRWDIHFIFIWKMPMKLVHAELASCSITAQDWRKAKYLRFHPAEAEFPIHVFHTHSPSSGKRSLTFERKKFVLRNLWNHALRCHGALLGSAAQPAEPTVVFIGDYIYDKLDWVTCLAGLNLSPSSSRSAQYVSEGNPLLDKNKLEGKRQLLEN